MLNEAKIHVVEDLMSDSLSIYLIEVRGNAKIHYTYNGEDIVQHEHQMGINVPYEQINPIFKCNLMFGRAFLSLLNDEITKQGINTHKVDMQAGKTELLQESLTFANQQLVKFIDHLTQPILNIDGSTR